jgi:carbon monoxide dehydrogenase subunit G
MWFLSRLASAADPQVEMDEAGVVRATAVVSAPPEQVLALLRDPASLHAVSGDEGKMSAVLNAGCFDVSYELDEVLADVQYTARACPTATGMRSDVVKSNVFRRMYSEWRVREVAGGTELSYEYKAELSLPVPDWMVRKRTKGAIAEMMARVASKFGS